MRISQLQTFVFVRIRSKIQILYQNEGVAIKANSHRLIFINNMLTKLSEVLKLKVTFFRLLLVKKRWVDKWQYEVKEAPFRKVNIFRRNFFVDFLGKITLRYCLHRTNQLPLFSYKFLYDSQRTFNETVILARS